MHNSSLHKDWGVHSPLDWDWERDRERQRQSARLSSTQNPRSTPCLCSLRCSQLLEEREIHSPTSSNSPQFSLRACWLFHFILLSPSFAFPSKSNTHLLYKKWVRWRVVEEWPSYKFPYWNSRGKKSSGQRCHLVHHFQHHHHHHHHHRWFPLSLRIMLWYAFPVLLVLVNVSKNLTPKC